MTTPEQTRAMVSNPEGVGVPIANDDLEHIETLNQENEKLIAQFSALSLEKKKEYLDKRSKGTTIRRLLSGMQVASRAFWAFLRHPKVSTMFTVGGLSIGLLSYWHAGKQADDLRRISGELSTSYVGNFPDNLDEIVKLVKASGEGEKLVIALDAVGYGILSNPAMHSEYETAIRAAARRGVSVNIITYDGELNRESTRRQFSTITSDPRRLRSFLAENKSSIVELKHKVRESGRESKFEQFEEGSEEWFVQLLWEVEELVQANFRGLPNIKICEINRSDESTPYAEEPLEMHFWGRVNKSSRWERAIFAFKIYPRDSKQSATETTFVTRDRSLMGVLEGRWERWAQCKDKWTPPL